MPGNGYAKKEILPMVTQKSEVNSGAGRLLKKTLDTLWVLTYNTGMTHRFLYYTPSNRRESLFSDVSGKTRNVDNTFLDFFCVSAKTGLCCF